MTLMVLILSLVVGSGSLAWGYSQGGLPQLASWILVFGGVWLIAAWLRWRWFAYLGLGFYSLAAALGLWFLDFPPGWMFAGAICGLVVWDLTDFQNRLRYAASDTERYPLERRHLLLIAILAILGFALASVAMAIRMQFNFEWAVLLVLVIAAGLIQIISWIRKRN